MQSLSRVEMERNRLKEELEQLRRQHRSLEEKMELTEEDLARQGIQISCSLPTLVLA